MRKKAALYAIAMRHKYGYIQNERVAAYSAREVVFDA